MTTASDSSPARTQPGIVLVDLSLEISNGMPAHALFPSPIILPYVNHEEAKAAGLGTADDPFTYAINYVSMLEHVGTHVDAPLHIGAGGASIDEVPLDLFTGKAVCLDLRHIPDLGDIDVGELQEAEEKAGVKIDGHIVLLCTGFHARHWPSPEVVTMNPGSPTALACMVSRGRRPTRPGRKSSRTTASAATAGWSTTSGSSTSSSSWARESSSSRATPSSGSAGPDLPYARLPNWPRKGPASG
jgi:kynurenine formamidase